MLNYLLVQDFVGLSLRRFFCRFQKKNPLLDLSFQACLPGYPLAVNSYSTRVVMVRTTPIITTSFSTLLTVVCCRRCHGQVDPSPFCIHVRPSGLVSFSVQSSVNAPECLVHFLVEYLSCYFLSSRHHLN